MRKVGGHEANPTLALRGAGQHGPVALTPKADKLEEERPEKGVETEAE